VAENLIFFQVFNSNDDGCTWADANLIIRGSGVATQLPYGSGIPLKQLNYHCPAPSPGEPNPTPDPELTEEACISSAKAAFEVWGFDTSTWPTVCKIVYSEMMRGSTRLCTFNKP
jgi:hypothetical protein